MRHFFYNKRRDLNIYIYRGLTLLFVVLFLASSTAGAKTITLATLDYLQDDLIVETGNITLAFYNSTNKNHSDVSILKLNYIPAYDLTVMKIESNDITYDYNFENNTKSYVFNSTDVNNTNFYVVKVNYSSIKVPESPWEYYQELLKQKNETIRLLRTNLTNITNNASSFNRSLKNALDRVAALEEYKSQTENIVANYDSLSEENRNLTVEIAVKNARVGALEEEKNGLQKTIDSFTPFAFTIVKGGSEQFYFNGVWFFIGGVVFVFVFVFFTSKKTAAIRNKGIEAASHKIHRRDVDIPDVPDIRTERPSVEKELLKPIKKDNKARHEDVASEIDSVIDNKKIDDILNKKW